MYKNTAYIFSVIIILSTIACNNSDSVLKLIEERDSLKSINKSQTERLNNYGQTIETLNATLDSIAIQENMIFRGKGDMPVTKDDIRHNLMRFEYLLKSQEQKIRMLEKKLAQSKDSTNQSISLIAHLKRQIEAKNIQIANLKAELENKNVSIAQLQQKVESQRMRIESQSAAINELNQRNRKQNEALARQDAILNNGYVLIGFKSDLKRKGVTKRGKRVANAVLDRSKFYKVDIRKWREISFHAKKPRILTNMPSSSYELTTAGDKTFTLHVNNPSDFWRISNYLIIQTD